ncbi:hypothetical protein GCM10018980_77160 [Streptomyces capoamus]|uniref:Uncharacterized protein n=1 Tax=Streptomyces capoamus TaxID=68183 RepID=A0A919F4Y3_9ACTN|nr:hypothetical protein GCM10018980_77160 [Streptomyces capoamus]
MAEHTLKDKVAVIGGGEKNLGGLLSRTFAEAGAKVVVHYHTSQKEAEETVQAIQDAGGQAVAVQGDLTEVASVRRLFDTAVDTYGGVDVAVNTTGMVLRKPILETTEDEYDRMFGINAKAGYFFIQEAGRRLNDRGKIISLGTSLLAAFTDGLLHLRRRQGATGALHPGGGQGVRRPVDLGERRSSGADGHPVLLRAGDPGAGSVPQVAGYGQPAHPHRGHRPADPVPGHRRLVDHRPDAVRQRRLHHPINHRPPAPAAPLPARPTRRERTVSHSGTWGDKG